MTADGEGGELGSGTLPRVSQRRIAQGPQADDELGFGLGLGQGDEFFRGTPMTTSTSSAGMDCDADSSRPTRPQRPEPVSAGSHPLPPAARLSRRAGLAMLTVSAVHPRGGGLSNLVTGLPHRRGEALGQLG